MAHISLGNGGRVRVWLKPGEGGLKVGTRLIGIWRSGTRSWLFREWRHTDTCAFGTVCVCTAQPEKGEVYFALNAPGAKSLIGDPWPDPHGKMEVRLVVAPGEGWVVALPKVLPAARVQTRRTNAEIEAERAAQLRLGLDGAGQLSEQPRMTASAPPAIASVPTPAPSEDSLTALLGRARRGCAELNSLLRELSPHVQLRIDPGSGEVRCDIKLEV